MTQQVQFDCEGVLLCGDEWDGGKEKFTFSIKKDEPTKILEIFDIIISFKRSLGMRLNNDIHEFEYVSFRSSCLNKSEYLMKKA